MQNTKPLIYTTQTGGFDKDRFRYAHPGFFNGQVRGDVGIVVVIGDWPDVARAYRDAGAKVFDSVEAMRAGMATPLTLVSAAPVAVADAAPVKRRPGRPKKVVQHGA